MATILCEGCDILIDGVNVTNGSYLPTGRFFTQYTLLGNGNGVFSGISTFPIANIYVHYTRADDGSCRQLTGRIYNTGTNPNSGWVSNALTGCTGLQGCTSRLIFYVLPNQTLYNQFPGSTFGVSAINYTNGQWTGLTFGTGTTVPTGVNGVPLALDTVAQECGTLAFYRLEGRWTAPIGLSGFIVGTSGHRTECTYCSPYEMVVLP
jgi:hypothetical protein